MNTLSWMIYAADVAESARNIFGVVTFFGCLGAALLAVPFLAGTDCASEEDQATLRKALKVCLIVAFASRLIALPIPSKETVYAIAASEMGERALNTPTADKAVKALNAWLDKQIAPEPKQ